MKNHLTSLCNGDYIYQIDADEIVNEYILLALPQLLEANDIDVLRVPRINTVSGLTQEHINKWGWRVNNKGWVNFPDYQWRIYRNNTESETLIKYEQFIIKNTPTIHKLISRNRHFSKI